MDGWLSASSKSEPISPALGASFDLAPGGARAGQETVSPMGEKGAQAVE